MDLNVGTKVILFLYLIGVMILLGAIKLNLISKIVYFVCIISITIVWKYDEIRDFINRKMNEELMKARESNWLREEGVEE